MNKIKGLLLISIILLSLILREYYIFLISLYAAFTLYWKEVFSNIYPLFYGIPLPQVQAENNVALVDLGFTRKYSILYRVSLVKHTIEDLEPDDFWRIIKYSFSGLPLSQNTNVTYIFSKNNDSYEFYVRIDIQKVNVPLKNVPAFIRSLKRNFENSGVTLSPYSYEKYLEEISGMIKWKNIGTTRPMLLASISLTALSAAFIYGGTLAKAALAPLLGILVTTIVARLKLRGYIHVSPSSLFYAISRNYSMEGMIDEDAVYSNSRTLYTVVSSLRRALIILSIKKLPVYTRETLGKRAYSLYELGTALDKLSLLAKSKFLYEILDKRVRKGEHLFLVNMRLTSENPQALISCLDSIGLRAVPLKTDLALAYIIF